MVSMPWSDFFRRTMYKGPMDRTLRMVFKSLCFSRFEVSWFLTNLEAGEIDLLIDGLVDWLVVLIFIGAHIQVPSIFYKMFLWLLSIRTAQTLVKQPVPAFFLYIVYRLGRRIQRCRCRLQPDTNGYHFFSPLRFMWNSGTIAGALQWPSDCILRHCSDLLHAPLHHFYSDCWCHDLSIQILWSTDWTVLCCWSVGLSQNVCLRRFCEVVLDSHSMEKSFWRIRIVRTLQSCAACLSRI